MEGKMTFFNISEISARIQKQTTEISALIQKPTTEISVLIQKSTKY